MESIQTFIDDNNLEFGLINIFSNLLKSETPNNNNPKEEICIYNDIASNIILNSSFYNTYCPELPIKLITEQNSIELCKDEIINNFDQNRDISNSIKLLRENKHCSGLKSIAKNIKDSNLESESEEIRKEILDLLEKDEKYISEKGKVVSELYIKNKKLGKWKMCLDELLNIKNILLKEEKESIENTNNEFKQIRKKCSELTSIMLDEEHKYSSSAFETINLALNKINEYAIKKQASKLLLSKSVLDEIELLRNFPDESIDNLDSLLQDLQDVDSNYELDTKKYLELDLTDTYKYVENNNYINLGIEKKNWEEITQNRKEDIIKVITSWESLKNKPTAREDINTKEFKSIEGELLTLIKSFASICSLYRTNDNGRIGVEPTTDWLQNKEIPFVFTTKIQLPKCSSLDNPVRFYIFSSHQTSKKYIGRIKDFIQEKGYDNYGFNVFVVLDNEEKFRKSNTYSATKEFPILGVNQLKNILFTAASKKSPKWEFVSLLTLNSKISTIQPFKTQGLVDSRTGIFVGRKTIINTILNSEKDFAIYGGRRIGKSSLLTVLRKEFTTKNYLVSYQSLQGIENSLNIGKQILADLESLGLRPNKRLEPTDNYDDFISNLRKFYTNKHNENQKVVIILDEMDELIIREKPNKKHPIIEIFRKVSQETSHKWRFIFAGYKEMFIEINGKGIYESWLNPWANFVDDTRMKLGELDSPRELINEGLKNILGLQYDQDVLDTITNYSTGHPAFIQKFCECLVKKIDKRISINDRVIYKQDVIDVFNEDTEFVEYVKDTLKLNLSPFQNLLTTIASFEKMEKFSKDAIIEKINRWGDDSGISINLELIDVDLELQLLAITGVVKIIKTNEYEFAHPHYIHIIEKLEDLDKNRIENLLKEVSNGE